MKLDILKNELKNMIKVIAFDYGGVIELKNGDIVQDIADYLQIKKEDWLKVYFTLNHLYNIGQHSWLEVQELTARKLNASDDQISHILEILKENIETRKLNFEIVEIIKELRNKNYKIALLSNNSARLRHKLIDHNIIELFDEVIISAEVGFQKPQPEIFEILFKRLGVESKEVVFVDDTKQSLLTAKEIGYIPILFTNNEKLKQDLHSIL